MKTSPLHATRFLSPFMGRVIVCVGSFALMVVEIVAGRVMAPYLGVSLYTWTGVIGTVLLGIGVGNAIGGASADRAGSRERLGLLCIASAFVVLLVNMIPRLVNGMMLVPGVDMWFRVLAFCLVVFFPSACVLGTLMPAVVKLTLTRLSDTGRVVGSIGAWGAIGSIVGTYAAGYWLIAFVGTGLLITLTSLALAILGCWVMGDRTLWRSRYAVSGVALLLGSAVLPSVCTQETNYYCIRVIPDPARGSGARILRLDHLFHSYVTPSRPDLLGYSYEQVYANLIAARVNETQPFSTLFIGGGGYVMPRYLNRFYPNASVTVAEIDPALLDVNRRLLGLPMTSPIKNVALDARMALVTTVSDKNYDFVFGDAFNDFSVPYHLTTVEFHRLLKSRMRSDGVYALNIIDDAAHGQFLAAMIRTLREVWQHVEVAPQADEINNGRNTYVLIASDTPLDLERWYASHPASEQNDPEAKAAREKNLHLLLPEEIDSFLRTHPAPSLRDDYAPVDAYVAPLFRDAY